jgi:hypothetical protein
VNGTAQDSISYSPVILLTITFAGVQLIENVEVHKDCSSVILLSYFKSVTHFSKTSLSAHIFTAS